MHRRLLGVIRLSKSRDESTSPERQREAIESIAAYLGDEIVGWAEDLDVSGNYVAPIDRPQLGEWMRNRADEFDGFAAWKMDRITRRALHFHEFLEWCTDHGKFFVTKADGIDTSTKGGKHTAEMMAMVGHWEWEAMQERARDSYEKLVTSGRWRGGFVPYGYRPVKHGAGWRLEPDPETSGIVREIVSRIIDGESANSIVRDLNTRKVPTSLDAQRMRAGKTPRGSTWRVANLLKMLRSKTLLGQYEADGSQYGSPTGERKVIRGSDGLPVQRAEPLLTRAEWEQLQAALERNGNKRAGNRRDGSLLLRIAFCAVCDRPMYKVPGSRPGTSWYRCSSRAATSVQCGNGAVKSADLESYVEDAVLAEIGHLERMIKVPVPGEDHTEELEQARTALAELTETLSAITSKAGRAALLRQITALDERIAKLEALPQRPPSVEWKGTGVTFAEHWASLDMGGRGRFLRASGVKARVLKWADLRNPADFPDLPRATVGGITYALGDTPNRSRVPAIIDVSIADLDELARQGTGRPLPEPPAWFVERYGQTSDLS